MFRDSNRGWARREFGSSPEAILWAELEGANISWLLLAESDHHLDHFHGYQIHVDPSKRVEAGTIFRAGGWVRPVIMPQESAMAFDQWVKVRDDAVIRVDVYFKLAFQRHNRDWRYVDWSNVIATRAQRPDRVWVAGDDHALPLLTFIRVAELGPPVSRIFVDECVDRYSGVDKMELSRLAQAASVTSDVVLPFALQRRFVQVRKNQSRIRFGGRPSITVGLIGPDGSGKTTLCDLVEKTLNGWVVRAYLGQKGYVLPGVAWAERPGDSIFAKLFKYLGYPLDLFVRWNRMSWRARGKIFVVDRLPMFPFANDGGGIIPAIYRRALPKFDLLIRLGGDERAIYDRKPEGDFSNFSKNAQKARELDMAKLSNACVELDATKPLQEVLDLLLNAIFTTPRFETRFLSQI